MLIQPPHIVARWIGIFILVCGFLAVAKALLGGHEVRLVTPAHAADVRPASVDWRQVSQNCTAQLAEQYHCASCSALWQQSARCVVKRLDPDVPDWVLATCIATVRDRTQNLPGATERVGPVVECATRRSLK